MAEDCGPLLKNDEVIRIDESGGSLENFHVQDQDGLGTCYANSLSVLLQSVLPAHPELSFLQIAAINGDTNVQNNMASSLTKITPFAQHTPTLEYPKKWEVAMNDGQICDTFIHLKKKQQHAHRPILCPKNKTNLEMQIINGDSSDKSYNSIKESSIYMNIFQNSFSLNAPYKIKEFASDFDHIISTKKQELRNNECKKINTSGLDLLLRPVLMRAIGLLPTCQTITNEDPATIISCKLVSIITKNIIKKTDYIYELDQMNPDITSGLKLLFESPNKTFSLQQMRQDFTQVFLTEIGTENFDKELVNHAIERFLNAIPTDKIRDLVAEYNEIQLNGFSDKCIDRLIFKYMTQDDFDHDWLNFKSLCDNFQLLAQAKPTLLEYDNSGLRDVESVLKFFKQNAGLNYSNAMMSLYAHDCSEKDKIKIPTELTCKKEMVIPDYHSKKRSNQQLNKVIINNLRKNHAVGYSICSTILDNANFDITKDPCSSHAVVIKGIKCVDGKYKYLVQNSWGLDLDNAGNLGIETGSKGDYWFNEESFYKGGLSIDYFDR